MKIIKGLLAALVLIAMSSVQAAQSPVPMLQKSADQILTTLKTNKDSIKNNKQIIYQAVKRYLLPIVDVAGMSRSVLGRQAWVKASDAERKEFSNAFTQLVIRIYATPLADYSDETIKFLPIKGSLDNHFIRVDSLIVRSKGNNIPLRYDLVNQNGQWKIYDLSVERVSLLQSFRSQFAQALQNSSMKELIQQMNKRSKAA